MPCLQRHCRNLGPWHFQGAELPDPCPNSIAPPPVPGGTRTPEAVRRRLRGLEMEGETLASVRCPAWAWPEWAGMQVCSLRPSQGAPRHPGWSPGKRLKWLGWLEGLAFHSVDRLFHGRGLARASGIQQALKLSLSRQTAAARGPSQGTDGLCALSRQPLLRPRDLSG